MLLYSHTGDLSSEQSAAFFRSVAGYEIGDSRELGTQNIYVREDGVFKKAGYLEMDDLERYYDMDFSYDKTTKIDGFAIQPYRYVSSKSFSLACALTDVYYLK